MKLIIALILCLFALPVCAEETDWQARYEATAQELADALTTINNLSSQILMLSANNLTYQSAERKRKAATILEELKLLDDQRKTEAEEVAKEPPKKKRRIESR